MNDPGLKNLLTWGIQHSDVSPKDASATPPRPMSEDDREALQSVIDGLRGQSDAERMKESMTVIENAEAQSEAKYTAFENFQMLLEVIDNANNMKPDDLWTRLIKQLESDDPKLRMYAAWCCGTAVQNNITSQERLLALDAIPTLVSMATEDIDRDTRKKAITAISSAVRNFQPGLDEAVSRMPTHYKPQERLDANDMNSVDIFISKLRENV